MASAHSFPALTISPSQRASSLRRPDHRHPGCRAVAAQGGQHGLSQRHAVRQRNARCEHYRQLVRPIALHYHLHCAEPLDDLIQVGLLGLLRAAELYRGEQGTPFTAFARPHVRGAILHYLRDQAALVRLPRRLDEQRQQLVRLRRSHPHLTDREEQRRALGLSVQQWQRLEAAMASRRPLSLDLGPDGGSTLEPQDAGPQAGVARAELEAIEAPSGAASGNEQADGDPLSLLMRLEQGQRAVLERVVLAGWSYRRTAAALKISPMTVQRRLHRGLAALRQQLRPGAGCRPVASAVPGC